MATETYPLAIPVELLSEVRQVADKAKLSVADAMRQAIRLGLPKLAEELGGDPLAGPKPLTKEDCERIWGPQTDGSENDRIAEAICKAGLPLEPRVVLSARDVRPISMR